MDEQESPPNTAINIYRSPYPAECEHCKVQRNVDPVWVADYLNRAVTYCDSCGESISLRTALLNSVSPAETSLFRTLPASLIGALSMFFVERIKAGLVNLIDLTEFGVPKGSKLLGVNYTAQGGEILPFEVRNHQLEWREKLKLPVYGAKFEIEDARYEDQGQICISVTYVPPQENVVGAYSLASAFDFYLQNQWGLMAVTAITGIEVSLTHLLDDFIPSWATVKDKDKLTRIYPDFCRAKGVPTPAEDDIDGVKRLWGARDEFAHRGKLFDGYNVESATKHIVSAVLFYAHLQHFFPSSESLE